MRRQYLRPGLMVVADNRVWVIDRMRPVALVLDAVTATQVGLVGWSQAPAGSAPERRVTLVSRDGLWVQQHGGPVVLVGHDGGLVGRYVSDAILGAVSPHGAWCAPEPRSQDMAATRDAPPRDHRTSAQLYLARADQVTRIVHVDAPVQSLHVVDGDLFVEVETGSWSRRPLGTSAWELVPQTAWLQLSSDQEVPDELSLNSHGCSAPPPAVPPRRGYHRLPDMRDLTKDGPSDDDGRPLRPHAQTSDLAWFVGSDPALTSEPEQVFALALDSGGTREHWRSPLGLGTVAAVAATDEHVWVAVEQPPSGSYRPSSATSVVRVAARTGIVQVVVDPDRVDITALSWPLGTPPLDAGDYAEFWQDRLSGLDHYWTHSNGDVGPLSPGLSNPRVDIVGEWPDTRLDVTFEWASRPQVRLRRTLALYDDLGRPEEPLYADINIMEDLDTGHVPDLPSPGRNWLDF